MQTRKQGETENTKAFDSATHNTCPQDNGLRLPKTKILKEKKLLN